MAKGFDSHITIWENNGWLGSIELEPYNPIIESEGLKRNQITSERNSMVRSTRAMLPDSIVFEESKPEGHIEIIPRMENVGPILMSHFQMTTQIYTGSSYLDTYVPSKFNPGFDGGNIYGYGTYGELAGDVYSIDVWRKHTDSSFTWNEGLDTQHFKRGICNNLSFKMNAGNDFLVRGEYKFKDFETLTTGSNPGDTDYANYTTGSITDWSHGTWAVTAINWDDASTKDIALEGVKNLDFTCSNNLTEKKMMGSGTRQTFSFGDYTVKGNITLEYINEEYQTLGNSPVSIVGTMWHSDTEYLAVSMPYCIIKPFDKSLVKPSSFIDVDMPFEAYENNGTAPITVTLHIGSQVVEAGFTHFDAGSTTRTLSQYDFADAGSTTRVLGSYNLADRDS